METDGLENELTDSLRHSERALDGAEATDRYVQHAKNARAFDAALRARHASIKASYRQAGLSYLLARKAVWLADFLDTHEREHPALWTKGPSILLFAREAERRLDREGRGGEVAALLRELAGGEPRDAVRKKYLRTEPGLFAQVLTSLRTGRVEPARRAYLRLETVERDELVRLSHALSRLIKADTTVEDDLAPATTLLELHQALQDPTRLKALAARCPEPEVRKYFLTRFPEGPRAEQEGSGNERPDSIGDAITNLLATQPS